MVVQDVVVRELGTTNGVLIVASLPLADTCCQPHQARNKSVFLQPTTTNQGACERQFELLSPLDGGNCCGLLKSNAASFVHRHRAGDDGFNEHAYHRQTYHESMSLRPQLWHSAASSMERECCRLGCSFARLLFADDADAD